MKIKALAATLTAVVGLSAVVPAQAMPMQAPAPGIERTTDVQQARVVVRRGYWHGHRGYRYGRPGYRRHSDGFWYPLAVFGPTIVVRPRVHRYYHRWCGPRHHRYRC